MACCAGALAQACAASHPDLPLIVIEDALSSNAPHIKELKRHNLRFILGVKPGDHQYLFAHVAQAHAEGRTTEFECERDGVNYTCGKLSQLTQASNCTLVSIL